MEVAFHYGSSDCWFKTGSTLYLKLGHEGAVLSGWSLGTAERVQVSPKALSRAEGARVLRERVGAATRQETPDTCMSSTQKHFAHIEWACSDAKETQGECHFPLPSGRAFPHSGFLRIQSRTGSAPAASSRSLCARRLLSRVRDS